MSNVTDADRTPPPKTIDLSGNEFHFVLTENDAPADQKRWAIDLQHGTLTVRLWNDAMVHCRTLQISRTGTEPTEIAVLPQGVVHRE